jgi:hypothetical protein
MPLNRSRADLCGSGDLRRQAEDGGGGRHHQISGRGAHRAIRPRRRSRRIRDRDHPSRHPHRAARRCARRRSRAAHPPSGAWWRTPSDEAPLNRPTSWVPESAAARRELHSRPTCPAKSSRPERSLGVWAAIAPPPDGTGRRRERAAPWASSPAPAPAFAAGSVPSWSAIQ